MTSIVYQTDKRSGITYAYESISYWDKEKKQSRAKRTLIGRVIGETKEVIPTDGRGRKKNQETSSVPNKQEAACEPIARYFYGATYLLDQIGEKLGITHDLQHCFPTSYQHILSIVYYLILEDKNPLYRFEKWSSLHKHPYGQNIPSQRSSELFAAITEEAKYTFFRLQGKRRTENEFWAYDTTSISSYSELLKQVRYGKSKEEISLPQFNIALVFGETSNLPFYYKKLAGNIPDCVTVKQLLADLNILGYSKVKLVMDRGFYSEANINALFKEGITFLIAASMSLVFMRKNLDTVYDTFCSFEHYNEKYELYSHTVKTKWPCVKHRSKEKLVPTGKRIYVHYYYNIDRAAEDEKSHDRHLFMLHQELISGNLKASHNAQYQQYFDVKTTPKRGRKVTVKKDVVLAAKRYYGFFALITNEPMEAITALEIYRNKDVVEKAFGNLKERLNMRRTLVSSEQSLDGKLFVEFIALIYLSYIQKHMQVSGLFKQYSMPLLFDTIDVIECFDVPGKKLQIGCVLEKHRLIYESLGVPPLTSL